MRDPTQQATSWQPDSAFGLPGSSIVQAMRRWASVSGRMRKASASGVGEGVAVGVGDSVGVRVDVSVATAVGEAAGAGVPGGAVEEGGMAGAAGEQLAASRARVARGTKDPVG